MIDYLYYILGFLFVVMALKTSQILVGRRPRGLGVKDGKFLAKIQSRPNNVSSQANRQEDPAHYVKPLSFPSPTQNKNQQQQDDAAYAMGRLMTVLLGMPLAKIVTTEGNTYLHAEFTSPHLGLFVDDVEFYIDIASRLIHVRSASRSGHSDFGVNRNRVETIRKKWQEQSASTIKTTNQ